MLFQAKHFNLLDNMCLNIGKIVAEKTFHLYCGTWESRHDNVWSQCQVRGSWQLYIT